MLVDQSQDRIDDGRRPGRRNVLAAAASPAFAASDPKVIEAAKKEGAVSLYTSASTGPSNAIAEAFGRSTASMSRFTGPDRPTSPRACRPRSRRGRTQADALIIEEPALSLLMPYLAEYDSPERAVIDAAYKAPKYTLIRMYMAQLGWNSNAVKGAETPKDWKDLLDPKWKGRFGSLDPHVTATTLAWQVMVNDLYGPSFLQAFGANRPKLYASTNAMSQAIVSGEVDLGITNSFGVIQMADTGAPIAGVIPRNTVLFGGNISVFGRRRIRTPRGCSVTSRARRKARPSSTSRARPSRRIRMRKRPKLDLSQNWASPHLQPTGLQEDHRRHAQAARRMGQTRQVTSHVGAGRRAKGGRALDCVGARHPLADRGNRGRHGRLSGGSRRPAQHLQG